MLTESANRRLKYARYFACVFLLAVCGASAAAGPASMKLTASRVAILNDGKDAAEIIVEVRDSGGNLVPDGTQVYFTSTVGHFQSAPTIETRSGVGRIRFYSTQKGTATITASSSGAYPGVNTLSILVTDDPAETFQGNSYISIEATGPLVYSVGDKIVEAEGKSLGADLKGLPGARLVYRNIEIRADRLQMDCTANVVRATGNIVLRRGTTRIECSRLFYPLTSGMGFAIGAVGKRIVPFSISGPNLKILPLPSITTARFVMTDLAKAVLVFTAREITVIPGDALQFKRARVYQNGDYVVSFAYYKIGLYATQLFSDQLVSFGSQGLGLNIPFYFDLSPRSTGIFSIRHGVQAGRGVFARQVGWSLDLTEGYNSVESLHRYTGQFGITGLNRSDWGVQWSHSQEVNPGTQGSFFIDMPDHKSLYGSTNFTHQMGPMYLGMDISANRTVAGLSSSGVNGSLYLETVPRHVGKSGYSYSVGGSTGYTRSQLPGFTTGIMTEGVSARFYSIPYRLDAHTSLTNYITVGNVWNASGQGGSTVQMSLTALRNFRYGNMQLTYDLQHMPGFIPGSGTHRLSMNLNASLGSRWNLNLLASKTLDAPGTSLLADMSVRLLPRWRLSLAATVQQYSAGSYRDYEIGLARTIYGRNIGVIYSTYNHRFYLDLQSNAF